MTLLQGRIALVTGGGRGIGRAISLALASAGAEVAISYRRDQAAALDTVAEITHGGRQARAYCAQLQIEEDCDALVQQVLTDFGTPTILVNNAGIASRGLSVAETHSSEVVEVMAIHAFAAHALCRLLIPHMRAAERSDIVMISSATTSEPIANGAPYNMAKAALEMLAYTVSREEREHGIRANVVAPGLVDTEMGRRLMRARAGILNISELDGVSPFSHVCKPSEVAKLVAFLVSPANTYMTGARIPFNAGGTVDYEWY